MSNHKILIDRALAEDFAKYRRAPELEQDLMRTALRAALAASPAAPEDESRSGLVMWQAYCEKKMQLEGANERIAELEAELRALRTQGKPNVIRRWFNARLHAAALRLAGRTPS